MLIIYNLVFYHNTFFGNRRVIYICYVTSDLWVYIFRGRSNLKKKLSTQSIKKIKELLLFDAWKVISPGIFRNFLESADLESDIKDILWYIIFIKFLDIDVKYKKHTMILKL